MGVHTRHAQVNYGRASCKKEDTSHFEIMKKQLQTMEAFVKLNSAWKNKEDFKSGVNEFNKSWHSIMLWLDS